MSMTADQQAELDAYVRELFTEYAFGNVFIALRFLAKYMVGGVNNFAIDDACAFVMMLFYAAYTGVAYVVTHTPHNVSLNEETAKEVPEEMYPLYIQGSRLILAGWLVYITFVWSVKAVAVALYARISVGLSREKMLVKIVAVFTAVTYVASMLCHILQCLPVHRSWQINPYPGTECTDRVLDYYFIGTLNPLTDLLYIALAIPVLRKLKIPLIRKLLLVPVLCSGFFIIIATCLRSKFSLDNTGGIMESVKWTSRECIVGVAAVCFPCYRPLFMKSTWTGERSGATSGGYSGNNPTGNQYELQSRTKWTASARGMRRLSSTGSEDHIIDKEGQPQNIQVTTEYTVSRD